MFICLYVYIHISELFWINTNQLPLPLSPNAAMTKLSIIACLLVATAVRECIGALKSPGTSMKGFTPDMHGNTGLTWPLTPETWQPHFEEATFTSTRV